MFNKYWMGVLGYYVVLLGKFRVLVSPMGTKHVIWVLYLIRVNGNGIHCFVMLVLCFRMFMHC